MKNRIGKTLKTISLLIVGFGIVFGLAIGFRIANNYYSPSVGFFTGLFIIITSFLYSIVTFGISKAIELLENDVD